MRRTKSKPIKNLNREIAAIFRKKGIEDDCNEKEEQCKTLETEKTEPHNRSIVCVGLCILVLTLTLVFTAYYLFQLFPEFTWVVYTSCKRVYQLESWNGKLYGVRIWYNGFKSIDSLESTYSTSWLDTSTRNASASKTIIRTDHSKFWALWLFAPIKYLWPPWTEAPYGSGDKHRPVIFIGTHHKTGTLLMKKLMGRICVMFNLCCVLRLTRDTVKVIENDIAEDALDIIGHTHWAWLPEKFKVPYLFVHLYRHPYQKVASGYSYHRRGFEEWTRGRRVYNSSCESSQLDLYRRRYQSSLDLEPYNTSLQTYNFCRFSLPCQVCCREEQDLLARKELKEYSKRREIEYEGEREGEIERFKQIENEFHLLCNHTSIVNSSLSHTLQHTSFAEGLRLQASLDFYENLRMARILNNTYNDKATINIDIDDFAADFDATIMRLIEHLQLRVNWYQKQRLMQGLRIYNMQKSQLYRFTLQLIARSTDTFHRKEALSFLAADADVNALYKRVFDLYSLPLVATQ